MSIVDLQYGHTFVVGAASASGFLVSALALFIDLIIKNNTKAIIKKSIILFKNTP